MAAFTWLLQGWCLHCLSSMSEKLQTWTPLFVGPEGPNSGRGTLKCYGSLPSATLLAMLKESCVLEKQERAFRVVHWKHFSS